MQRTSDVERAGVPWPAFLACKAPAAPVFGMLSSAPAPHSPSFLPSPPPHTAWRKRIRREWDRGVVHSSNDDNNVHSASSHQFAAAPHLLRNNQGGNNGSPLDQQHRHHHRPADDKCTECQSAAVPPSAAMIVARGGHSVYESCGATGGNQRKEAAGSGSSPCGRGSTGSEEKGDNSGNNAPPAVGADAMSGQNQSPSSEDVLESLVPHSLRQGALARKRPRPESGSGGSDGKEGSNGEEKEGSSGEGEEGSNCDEKEGSNGDDKEGSNGDEEGFHGEDKNSKDDHLHLRTCSEAHGFEDRQRVRFVWTAELHERFLDAVKQLGINSCMPKHILQVGTGFVWREVLEGCGLLHLLYLHAPQSVCFLKSL